MEAPLEEGKENFLRLKKDPWGGDYTLVWTGVNPVVRSHGPDGEPNTKDDVIYPE